MSASSDWGTPPHVLRLVREVLGPIELDPASSPEFNRTVQASRILTPAENALAVPWGWARSIYLNPPGGVESGKPLAAAFWGRLLEHRRSPGFGHAIFLGFSLSILATTQSAELPVMAFPFCVLRRRLSFLREEGTPAGAPTHNNLLVYVPGEIDGRRKFVETFRRLGAVVDPGRGGQNSEAPSGHPLGGGS
jgi:hypothetical protein